MVHIILQDSINSFLSRSLQLFAYPFFWLLSFFIYIYILDVYKVYKDCVMPPGDHMIDSFDR